MSELHKENTTSYAIADQPQFPKNRVKIAVFGSSGVGKSTFACRVATGTVHEVCESAPQRRAFMKLVGNMQLKVEIAEFDCTSLCTPNGENTTSSSNDLPTREFVDASAALLLYDTSQASSFEGAVRALTALQRLLPPDCDICLLGTKSDLRERRQVSFFQAENVAKRLGLSLFEISGVNCEEALMEVLERHIERRLEADEYVYESIGIIKDPQQQEAMPARPSIFCSFWPWRSATA